LRTDDFVEGQSRRSAHGFSEEQIPEIAITWGKSIFFRGDSEAFRAKSHGGLPQGEASIHDFSLLKRRVQGAVPFQSRTMGHQPQQRNAGDLRTMRIAQRNAQRHEPIHKTITNEPCERESHEAFGQRGKIEEGIGSRLRLIRVIDAGETFIHLPSMLTAKRASHHGACRGLDFVDAPTSEPVEFWAMSYVMHRDWSYVHGGTIATGRGIAETNGKGYLSRLDLLGRAWNGGRTRTWLSRQHRS
jgi:hypothetical protein